MSTPLWYRLPLSWRRQFVRTSTCLLLVEVKSEIILGWTCFLLRKESGSKEVEKSLTPTLSSREVSTESSQIFSCGWPSFFIHCNVVRSVNLIFKRNPRKLSSLVGISCVSLVVLFQTSLLVCNRWSSTSNLSVSPGASLRGRKCMFTAGVLYFHVLI